MALRTVAIVGRPNVGKSTLFNRILGRRVAIVAERPGVTRDRQFAEAEWAGRRFLLVDTGGLVEQPDEHMDLEVRRQAETAIGHADVVVLVVDGREGVQAVDRHVAELLRRSGLPVVLGVNKLDELGDAIDHLYFYELGLGDPTPLAALSGKGSGDLLDRVVGSLPESAEDEGAEVDIRIAVIGRPNVGKSSFVNRLLGEERLIVHEEAGTTRDAIDTDLEVGDRRVRLIDTAGLRRQARIVDNLEFLGRLRAASAIDRADICLLLVDTEAGAANQDFRIGHQAWDAGKGVVFVANKWDLIEDRGPGALAGFERELRGRAHYLRWVPIITCSALTGKRVSKVIDLAFAVQEARAQRIRTSEVNQVLQNLVARRQPPQGGRGDVRLLYASQVAASPPLFILWSNRPHDLKEHYVRYLVAGFREAWGFEGSPIRIKLKKRSGRE
ncbi:ribosome biogenesis GTPase Der [Candidatus Palauibacter sp.]|uniref:ribosome biogenesis GTPase Der n=1 Tax=Candidatus Palauibacter sp. TaxID=3101350 RepID=UPI003B599712